MAFVIESGKTSDFPHGGNMDEKIKQAFKEAIKNGTQRLRIVFREDSISRLCELERLTLANQIKMRPEENAKALEIRFSGKWEHDSNRIFIISIAENFSLKYFIYTIRGALESIEACVPQPKPIRKEYQQN